MKRNMRRIALAVIALAFSIVLAGCGETTLYGEVAEVTTDAQTGVFSFVLMQDDTCITVVTDENTHIFSWLDEVSESDFMNGSLEGIFVSVTGRTSRAQMNASEVQISHLRIRDVYTLENVTKIDRIIGTSHSFYCLEDGTELLLVQDTIGPDNVHSGMVESLDALSQEAQQNIKKYYDGQGILYDIPTTLEKAYAAYCTHKDEFTTYMLSQEMVPTASGDQVIYFLTVVTSENAELRLGAAFDKETGRVIPASDLFACRPEEFMERFAEICKVEDRALIAEMKANFKPEYVIFFPDNLEVTFPAESLPTYGLSHGMGYEYSAEVLALLQPWAVPKGTE